MPCFIDNFNGNKTFLCFKDGERCAECHGLAINLCDYPILNGKTCDRLLCNQHSNEILPDHHYCTAHFKQYCPDSANKVFVTSVEGINERNP